MPYHSPKMEPLEQELLESLRDIRPKASTTPFFSTVTGTAMSGSEVDARYWYRNVRDPVYFRRTMGSAIAAGHRVFLEIGAHPVLRRDIASCLSEQSVPNLVLGSLRREERERAALLGSLGRLYTAGADLDWSRVFPEAATTVKLPAYPFQPEQHWRESEDSRRIRTGSWDHPLLGVRLALSNPSWKGDLVSTELDWIADHVIAGSTVFPGAGYVEMALAAARTVHGDSPCTLEEIEFQKFLVVDPSLSMTVQTELDTASGELGIHVRSDPASSTWDRHARIRVKALAPPSRPALDLAEIRRRCPDAYDREECLRRFSVAGFLYGPTFQGIEHLWCGQGEDLAEICVPESLLPHLSDYRMHPAVLDACFQPIFALFPFWNSGKGTNDIFVPVKIDQVCFHAPLQPRMFVYMRLVHLVPTEIKVDLQIVDEGGVCLAEIFGLTARQAAQRPQAFEQRALRIPMEVRVARSGPLRTLLASPAVADGARSGSEGRRRQPAAAAAPGTVPEGIPGAVACRDGRLCRACAARSRMDAGHDGAAGRDTCGSSRHRPTASPLVFPFAWEPDGRRDGVGRGPSAALAGSLE